MSQSLADWSHPPLAQEGAVKGVQLVEATNRLSGALEESNVGASPLCSDENLAGEGDEQREEAFEATIVRLDRKAAEMLFRLAGL